MTYDRLIAGALGLGRPLARLSEPGERVGLLMPNAAGTAVAFFALQAFGRVPALLNFSTGFAGMSAACRAADLKLILTSREFLAAARLEETAARLSAQAKLVYLEDVAAAIGPFARLGALLAGTLARFRPPRQPAPNAPAVVLFTSGSEGAPKGVALSHENLLANRYQMGALVDFNPTDIVFNALPIFHSFGLTGGLLLPLLAGVKTFLYPSPLHYRIVPLLAYDSNATIIFGTDTFLAGYARAAHGYDFYSVRYVFAGAERVREETRRAFADRFGLRILEGYGATETAPVIAVNTPMQYKPGTVGRFVPGLTCKLEPIAGVSEGQRLLLSGPNVMLGYLTVDRPGELQPPPGGVYDTGDIVSIDAQGFITLKGRVKRFAKVAGEMVSLAAVEETALKLWPGTSVRRDRGSRPPQGRAARAGDRPCRRHPRSAPGPCPRPGPAGALPAAPAAGGGATAPARQRQARLPGDRQARRARGLIAHRLSCASVPHPGLVVALRHPFVIPAQAGIQSGKTSACPLDPRFRGGDDRVSPSPRPRRCVRMRAPC